MQRSEFTWDVRSLVLKFDIICNNYLVVRQLPKFILVALGDIPALLMRISSLSVKQLTVLLNSVKLSKYIKYNY